MPRKKSEPATTITAWIPKEVMEAIQAIADKERRSKSSAARNILLDWYESTKGGKNDTKEIN